MRIVCLTEETVELFFKINRPDLIVGRSVYAVRPKELKDFDHIPKVTAFTHANIQKIKNLKPDLIIGYSDVQKEIAKNLVDEGLPVLITSQRTISEIIETMRLFGRIVGEEDKTNEILSPIIKKIESLKQINYSKRKKVYFEEWDSPHIGASPWIHELIELCGGESLFKERSFSSHKSLFRQISPEEIISENPDIILYSWCGKKGDPVEFSKRDGFNRIKAVQNGRVYELESEIILQPGLASLTDGIEIISELVGQL